MVHDRLLLDMYEVAGRCRCDERNVSLVFVLLSRELRVRNLNLKEMSSNLEFRVQNLKSHFSLEF
jgi:hypothetical protein